MLGWQSHYVTVRLERRLVGGAMVLVRRSGRFGRVGYVCRAPLLRPEAGHADVLAQAVLTELKAFAKTNGLRVLIVAVPYRGQGMIPVMRALGYVDHPWGMPPSRLPNGTIVHNCQVPREEMLASFRRSTRQEINRGLKRGFRMRMGGEGDLPAFWDMVVSLCRRRNASPNIPGLEYVRRVWRTLSPSGSARLYVGEVNDSVVTSLMCIRQGNWLFAWRIGWSGEHAEAFPTKSLYWQVMQAAAAEGVVHLDFMDLNMNDVRAAQATAGADPPKSAGFGVNFFKLGFGGTIIELPTAMDYFPNPLIRGVMRAGLASLLNHRKVRRVFFRLYQPVGRRGTRA